MTGQAARIFGKVLVAVLSAILGAAGLVLAPAAIAGPVESAYTPLVLEKCDNITPSEMAEHGAVFRCAGFGGTDVRVAKGDLRMFVSYGKRAADQAAAGQTLPAFNSIGERLEWRIKDGKAFATILRFRWDGDGAKGSTLVVTKLGKTDSCHVAYVQAEKNPHANRLAREVADEDARRFSCKRDQPRTYGPDGKPID